MAQQGGFGVVLKITVSAALTAIVGVLDVKFPKFKKYLEESTTHGSTSGYYEAVASGKRRVEAFSCILAWDDTEATHAAVLAAFNSDSPVNMSIQDPDGDEVIAFAAHIEEIERISEQDKGYKATVTIHPTGAPTIT